MNLTPQRAAELITLSEPTYFDKKPLIKQIRSAAKKGTIRAKKEKGKWAIPMDSVLAFARDTLGVQVDVGKWQEKEARDGQLEANAAIYEYTPEEEKILIGSQRLLDGELSEKDVADP